MMRLLQSPSPLVGEGGGEGEQGSLPPQGGGRRRFSPPLPNPFDKLRTSLSPRGGRGPLSAALLLAAVVSASLVSFPVLPIPAAQDATPVPGGRSVVAIDPGHGGRESG